MAVTSDLSKKFLTADARLTSLIADVLRRIAVQVESAVVRKTRDVGAVHMGLMMGGWSVQPFQVLGEAGGEGGTSWSVINELDYASYVEFGTRPHFPPLEPLRLWVQDKIQPHVTAVGVEFSSGRGLPTTRGTRRMTGNRREKEILRVARLIQRKIGTKGTAPKRIVASTLEEMGIPYVVSHKGEMSVFECDMTAALQKLQVQRIIDTELSK